VKRRFVASLASGFQ